MTRSNAEIAAALHEVADLLELKGENRYRILGFRRGAEAVEALTREACGLNEAQLLAVRGVGKGVAARVLEFCSSGGMRILENLRAEVPPGMRALTRVPGLGPKKAMLAFKELGISTIEELKAAAEAGRLRGVKGFGERTEQQILGALERGETTEQRMLLARALPLAAELLEDVRSCCPEVVDASFAGSLRRMRETVGDIDLLAATDHPERVMQAFKGLRWVRTWKADGPTKASVLTTRGFQVDLRVVPVDAYGAALQYFTGSQAHNVKVREHAVRRGLKLSEYGLFDARTQERIAGSTEAEVYEALGMSYIPATMREDRGEVEAALAGELPSVVELGDMRGDLQSHSTYSDGKLSVREMALAAAERGYEYFAVTDHGPRLTYMRNLSSSQIVAQREEVAAVNAELGSRLRLLHGVELNIGADGSLDYDDDVLAGFDICVASIHSSFRASRADQTRRLLRAIENPHVHVIGHPSGRRLDRREGIDFDVAEVARAAARHGVALEINAHPYRLDLRDEHVRVAREHGARFVISTDAHSVAELDHMGYGVAVAQRAWVGPDEVVNTGSLDALLDFLAKRRG